LPFLDRFGACFWTADRFGAASPTVVLPLFLGGFPIFSPAALAFGVCGNRFYLLKKWMQFLLKLHDISDNVTDIVEVRLDGFIVVVWVVNWVGLVRGWLGVG
jgi:hypothetical protein